MWPLEENYSKRKSAHGVFLLADTSHIILDFYPAKVAYYNLSTLRDLFLLIYRIYLLVFPIMLMQSFIILLVFKWWLSYLIQ